MKFAKVKPLKSNRGKKNNSKTHAKQKNISKPAIDLQNLNRKLQDQHEELKLKNKKLRRIQT
jgi:hypothetical protein